MTSTQNGGNIVTQGKFYTRKNTNRNIIKSIVELGRKTEKPIFSFDRKDNHFPIYTQKIQSKDGFYDVITHGTYNNVEFFNDNIDAELLSIILKSRDDYKIGTKVRLLSCNTGNTEISGNCFAQILANELNVIVEAPTQIINVYSNGTFFIDNDANPFNPKGKMKLFYPRGK